MEGSLKEGIKGIIKVVGVKYEVETRLEEGSKQPNDGCRRE